MAGFTVGYPFPTPVLPNLNGFDVKKTPTYDSLVAQSVSGRELSSPRQAYPLWEFDLTYEILRDPTQNQNPYAQYTGQIEFQQILDMFLACSGQFGRFFFNDLSDNSRSAQFIGISDGTTTTYRLSRTWGSGSLSFVEPVGGINLNMPFVVYLNGTPTGAFGFDEKGQNLILSSAPTSGVVITMDYYFYYFCRFLNDITDFEQFYANLWMMKSFKFRSVKI